MDPTEIDYTQLSFPDPPADRPFVAINMVMSADGRTVVDGTERGLGSKLDQRLMRELRVHFDVVMNGGATFRASGTSARLNDPGLEQWRLDRGMSASPTAAVLTRSGDLPPGAQILHRRRIRGRDLPLQRRTRTGSTRLESRSRSVVIVPDGNEAAAALRSHENQSSAHPVSSSRAGQRSTASSSRLALSTSTSSPSPQGSPAATPPTRPSNGPAIRQPRASAN